jgi:hypothetical protein
MDAEPRGIFVRIRSATKIRILLFYLIIVRLDQEEENQHLEKLGCEIRQVCSPNA